MSSGAASRSATLFGRATVSTAFSTVPQFSNSDVTVRRIQPDIWLRRMTRPLAIAMLPTLTLPPCHRTIERTAMARMRAVLRRVSVTVMSKIERIRPRKAFRCRAMPSRPNASSRSAWANSLTTWMLV